MHNEFTHSTMLSVYRRVGMAAEADALRQQLMAVQLTAGLITARLGDLHLQLCRAYETAAMASLLAEADQLWRQAAQQPLQLMNHVTTMCMLKLHQHVGDIARQQSIIEEALNLERAASNVESGSSVFVHAGCFCMLFDSFARSPQPADYVSAAQSAYRSMLQRRAEATSKGWYKRELKLIVTEVAQSAYLKFLQRAGRIEEMMQMWRGMSAEDSANQRILTAVLNAMAGVGGCHLQAEQIMEAAGESMQLGVQQFTAWLACYRHSGGWRGAESVWQRMQQSGVVPDSSAYRELMQVYMSDGSAEQLAKIESLYAEMQRGDGRLAGRPLHLSVADYEKLIKCAHMHDLPTEVHKWADRAREFGAWHQLDTPSQDIVQKTRRHSAAPPPQPQQ